MKKRLLTSLLAGAEILSFMGGCTSETSAPSTADDGNNGGGTSQTAEINIAYQYGLAYAPLIVCQEKKLIEEAYKSATGGEVTVTWTQMSSGADINTGIASGTLDVGFLGVAPAISGVAKNVGYKIFTNLSGQ
ncbi:MAG: ABC transporter substrate-binding protein, partial [Lachnospiraceae bacterium]|nr:ABC transporter substrate-binding protein [Lachnospiraceae bacterium]